MSEQYEVIVVGSGEAGKYLAWTMAEAGYRTALIEQKLVGGSCPNVACLPSKNVIQSAKVASYLLRRSDEFGVVATSVRIDMPAVYRRKQAMVDDLIAVHRERFRSTGVELIMGKAKFTGKRRLEVILNAGESRMLTAERLFLNLGTRSVFPAIPGLSEVSPMTHVEALDLQRVPEHLLVLGAGYIALELAQAFRRFGSSVTIIERGSQVAGQEDADAGAALLKLLEDDGIKVHLNTTVTSVLGRSGSSVELNTMGSSGQSSLRGSDLLIATGRVANTQGIGLEQLGVQLDSHGYVEVNEKLETTAPNVWAVGDCAGTPQFTHAAYDDYRIVRDNLLGNGAVRTTHKRLIPSCLFTDPEFIRIGLNEKQARQLGIPYRVAQMPAAAVLRTRTLSEPRGFLKMLIAEDSDKILGFTAFCAEASELLAAVQTAMAGNLPYTVLRDSLFAHPTIAEGFVFMLSEIPKQVPDQSTVLEAVVTG